MYRVSSFRSLTSGVAVFLASNTPSRLSLQRKEKIRVCAVICCPTYYMRGTEDNRRVTAPARASPKDIETAEEAMSRRMVARKRAQLAYLRTQSAPIYILTKRG